MKYSEFKREVEKLGFTHSKRCEQVFVKVDGQTVMDISTGRKYIVDNEWNKYQQLNETTQGKLFDLAYQLAKTPLAEREEEKRYWLQKIPVPVYFQSHFFSPSLSNRGTGIFCNQYFFSSSRSTSGVLT